MHVGNPVAASAEAGTMQQVGTTNLWFVAWGSDKKRGLLRAERKFLRYNTKFQEGKDMCKTTALGEVFNFSQAFSMTKQDFAAYQPHQEGESQNEDFPTATALARTGKS